MRVMFIQFYHLFFLFNRHLINNLCHNNNFIGLLYRVKQATESFSDRFCRLSIFYKIITF